MKNLVILGSTGTIGQLALDVVRKHKKEIKILGLSGNKNKDLLKKQVEEFKPRAFCLGEKELVKLATLKEADTVLVAVSGMAGLLPTLSAIKMGKRVCLANKEILVTAGRLILKEAKKYKAEILPIDSEISAIFQSLKSGKISEVKKIYLTMGKGRLTLLSKEELKKVKLKEILNRPAWVMGQKMAVDSATGVNKAFEVIEVSNFFNIPQGKIEIIVHPEYFCHSLVEFKNGSIIGEFGESDMRRYIEYAIFYPERKDSFSGSKLVGKTLTFEAPPFGKFPCLTLGYKVAKTSGTMPAVFHGADKTAVEAFLKEKIKFTDIYSVIQKTLAKHKVIKNPSLEEIIRAERWGQEEAKKYI